MGGLARLGGTVETVGTPMGALTGAAATGAGALEGARLSLSVGGVVSRAVSFTEGAMLGDMVSVTLVGASVSLEGGGAVVLKSTGMYTPVQSE
jgi:hypothetical protein